MATRYKPRFNGNPECGGGTAIIAKETINHSRIAGLDTNLDHVGIKVETTDFCLICFHFTPLLTHLKKK